MKTDKVLPELAVDLYKNTHNDSQIKILTCHSQHTRKFFKSFVQLNTAGDSSPVVAFSTLCFRLDSPQFRPDFES